MLIGSDTISQYAPCMESVHVRGMNIATNKCERSDTIGDWYDL